MKNKDTQLMASSLIWRHRDCKIRIRFTYEGKLKWNDTNALLVAQSFGTYNLAKECPFILNYKRSVGKLVWNQIQYGKALRKNLLL